MDTSSSKHGVSFERASPGQRLPDNLTSAIDFRDVADVNTFYVLIDYGSPDHSTTPQALAVFSESQAWELRENIVQALDKP